MKMGCKSKSSKYWYQSTGRGMRNDRTMRPASGLNRKPWNVYIFCSKREITVNKNKIPRFCSVNIVKRDINLDLFYD